MIAEGLFLLFKELLFFVGIIGNSGSFPEPLNPQDEKMYLERYYGGDKEARRILIEHNLRLVAHVCKKFNTKNTENDDLISIGTIGLIKAISTYNPNKNVQLATYAARCIENEILMSIRSSKKHRNEVSINDPIGIDGEGNEISLMDILGTTCDFCDQVESKMQIEKLRTIIDSTLKPREKIVLELRYGLKNGCFMAQREIAEILGISRSYVSRIEKKALQKLSDAVNNAS